MCKHLEGGAKWDDSINLKYKESNTEVLRRVSKLAPSPCFANLEGWLTSASVFGGAGLFRPSPLSLAALSGDLDATSVDGLAGGGKVKLSDSNFIAADASILPSWNREIKACVA